MSTPQRGFQRFRNLGGTEGCGRGSKRSGVGALLWSMQRPKSLPVFAFQRERIELSKSSAALCPCQRRVCINLCLAGAGHTG